MRETKRTKRAPKTQAKKTKTGASPVVNRRPAPVQENMRMSDTDNEEIGSIVEYSEDVSEQEPPKPLPPGQYEGVIKAVENKRSQKGNLYADVVFHIGPDQFPADYEVENNPEGLSIHLRTTSLEDTPKARYGMRKFLEAIGAKGGKSVDTSEWVGLSARVNVAHGTWEGVTREEIKSVSAL